MKKILSALIVTSLFFTPILANAASVKYTWSFDGSPGNPKTQLLDNPIYSPVSWFTNVIWGALERNWNGDYFLQIQSIWWVIDWVNSFKASQITDIVWNWFSNTYMLYSNWTVGEMQFWMQSPVMDEFWNPVQWIAKIAYNSFNQSLYLLTDSWEIKVKSQWGSMQSLWTIFNPAYFGVSDVKELVTFAPGSGIVWMSYLVWDIWFVLNDWRMYTFWSDSSNMWTIFATQLWVQNPTAFDYYAADAFNTITITDTVPQFWIGGFVSLLTVKKYISVGSSKNYLLFNDWTILSNSPILDLNHTVPSNTNSNAEDIVFYWDNASWEENLAILTKTNVVKVLNWDWTFHSTNFWTDIKKIFGLSYWWWRGLCALYNSWTVSCSQDGWITITSPFQERTGGTPLNDAESLWGNWLEIIKADWSVYTNVNWTITYQKDIDGSDLKNVKESSIWNLAKVYLLTDWTVRLDINWVIVNPWITDVKKAVAVWDGTTLLNWNQVHYGNFLFLKNDWTVWGLWKDSWAWELWLGNGFDSALFAPFDYTSNPIQLPLSDIKDMDSYNNLTIFLDNNNNLFNAGWDMNQIDNMWTSFQYNPTQLFSFNWWNWGWVKKISVWFWYILILRNDWTVESWGKDMYGFWCLWTKTSKNYNPVNVLWTDWYSILTNVKDIVARNSNSSFLLNDWTVLAVGYGYDWALGNNLSTNSDFPVQVLDTDWITSLSSVSKIYRLGSGGFRFIVPSVIISAPQEDNTNSSTWTSDTINKYSNKWFNFDITKTESENKLNYWTWYTDIVYKPNFKVLISLNNNLKVYPSIIWNWNQSSEVFDINWNLIDTGTLSDYSITDANKVNLDSVVSLITEKKDEIIAAKGLKQFENDKVVILAMNNKTYNKYWFIINTLEKLFTSNTVNSNWYIYNKFIDMNNQLVIYYRFK